MNLRWLLLLGALSAVPMVGCDSKSKDSKAEKADEDDEDDAKDKEKKKKKKDKEKEGGEKSAKASGEASVATPPVLPAPPSGPAPVAPLSKEQFAEFLKDKSKPLTSDVFETALLGLAECRLETSSIDYKCQALKNFHEASSHKSEDFKTQGMVALKHLRHPANAVRFKAAFEASLRAFSYDAPKEGPTQYLEAAKAETDPIVLAQQVSHLTSGGRKNAEIRTFLMETVEHKEPRVREAAARILGDAEVLAATSGGFDKLLAKTQSDPDTGVRAAACAGLGSTQDPKSIPVFKQLLEDASTADELKQGCWDGLIQTWVALPYPKAPLKEGFELVMKGLEAKPRNKNTPPWRGLSKLQWAKTEFKNYDKSGAEWYGKVKPYYEQPRLIKALESIALDKDANTSARTDVLYTLRQFKQQKLLATIATALKKQGADAKYLAERADKLSKEKDK